MTRVRLSVALVVLVLLVSGVAGCGGGDSSSPTAPTAVETPTAVAYGVCFVTSMSALQTPDFEVIRIPSGDPLSDREYDKCMKVFGVTILSTPSFSDTNLIYVATITAEYLDNNEDGVVDDLGTNSALLNSYATFFVAGSEFDGSGPQSTGRLEDFGPLAHIKHMARQYEHETTPGGTLCGSRCGASGDATLEEMLHLIQKGGYAYAHPDLSSGDTFDRYRRVPNLLTEAMDVARGGYHPTTPAVYPDSAWYHYTDASAGYYDHATEYFYWGLTTLFGAQGDLHPAQCEATILEWEPCTRAKFEAMDVKLYALLTNPLYKLPTQMPDGRYR
jgi:hypothetical protein